LFVPHWIELFVNVSFVLRLRVSARSAQAITAKMTARNIQAMKTIAAVSSDGLYSLNSYLKKCHISHSAMQSVDAMMIVKIVFLIVFIFESPD